jgi:hypothetical protein
MFWKTGNRELRYQSNIDWQVLRPGIFGVNDSASMSLDSLSSDLPWAVKAEVGQWLRGPQVPNMFWKTGNRELRYQSNIDWQVLRLHIC